jgi:hypothetical protein
MNIRDAQFVLMFERAAEKALTRSSRLVEQRYR